jgi:hypothetical protein
LSNLFDLDRDRMVSLLKEQAKALRNPPRTLAELIAGLAKTVPDFAAEVAGHAGIVLS